MKKLKDNIFKLIYRSGPHGDECSTYDLEIGENVTLAEFLEYLDPQEWGDVRLVIQDPKLESMDWLAVNEMQMHIDIEYKDGKITNLPEEALSYMNTVVKSGWSNGGWSRMDYWLKFE